MGQQLAEIVVRFGSNSHGNQHDAGRKTFTYIYHFGDNWSHTVKLQKIVPMIEDEPSAMLLEAAGRCPPEDCGGPPGYERLLEILGDRDDEEHDDMLAWCGGPFDPTHAELPKLEANIDLLARRWAPRRRATTRTKT